MRTLQQVLLAVIGLTLASSSSAATPGSGSSLVVGPCDRGKQDNPAFTACLQTAAGAPDSLAAARALWSTAQPQNYSYVVEHVSLPVTLCRNARSEWVQLHRARITVRAGNVVRARTLRGQEIPASCFGRLYTMDKLFAEIALVQSHPADSGDPCIQVTYDATFGFPSDIDGTCYLDGDWPISVREFRVLK